VTIDESRLRHSANFAKVGADSAKVALATTAGLATSAESLGYDGWTSSATLAQTWYVKVK